MSLKDFIEHNRRTGSTTHLAQAAIAANGYLIVEDRDNANHVLNQFPGLKGRVLTLAQVRDGKYPEDKRPLFFDVPGTLYRLPPV